MFLSDGQGPFEKYPVLLALIGSIHIKIDRFYYGLISYKAVIDFQDVFLHIHFLVQWARSPQKKLKVLKRTFFTPSL